jgi:UDP-N-acetylmuramoylalanine--D-glutamate ligase
VGRNVVVAGNIGLPLGDIADVEYDDVVMELSSFQLHWTKNIAVHLGIITNLDPDHLDWHGSFEKYVQAKFRLFDLLTDGGALIGQERERVLYRTHERMPTVPFAWEDSKELERVVFFEKESCFLRQGDERMFLFDRRIVPIQENTMRKMPPWPWQRQFSWGVSRVLDGRIEDISLFAASMRNYCNH